MYKNGKGFKEKTMIEKLPDGHIIKTMVKEHKNRKTILAKRNKRINEALIGKTAVSQTLPLKIR